MIWNEDDSVYRQNLHDPIMGLIAASPEAALVDKPGGIFVRRGEQMSEEDRVLLQTVARVVLRDEAGTLAEQVERRGRIDAPLPVFKPQRRRPEALTAAEVPKRDLAFFNGFGGFTHDGREYITSLAPGQNTPAPWCNVIANPNFGTVVSESGSIYTWSENSHEFRLTPWYNDPVTDAGGEALYIRDEENGRFWSPSPLPARRDGVRHSPRFWLQHLRIFRGRYRHGIDALRRDRRTGEIRPAESRQSLRPAAAQLSITAFWELVLGELREKTSMHVITESDPLSGALLVRNPYNTDFADRVVFFDCSEQTRTITGDRTEFLGRNGSPANPAAMRRTRLSGRVGAGLDPCAAMQVPLALDDGQEREIVFTTGAAAQMMKARQLLLRFRGAASAQQALEGVWQYWRRTLGVVYVETPDPAVNFLANGWLIYQVLACRMWARTGFYQSGGAFGFRDQLQDAMALLHAEPLLLREHLLRAAAHQFKEGDVQHWWHPPAGRGVRTHFSDDYLWLPYATCRYVIATGDTGVLDEKVPFLEGRLVRPEEEAYYDLPHVSETTGTLYEHCVRAIDNGLRFGVHGLPLMGCGDWNDGMNLVGEHGKGRKRLARLFPVRRAHPVLPIWPASAATREFADKCTLGSRPAAAAISKKTPGTANGIAAPTSTTAQPLGSAESPECQIDSLPQSWSVLSGAGELGRIATGDAERRSSGWCGAMPGLSSSSIRPSTNPPSIPATSRATSPACAKTAANTPTPPSGPSWPSPHMGDRDRAWELFNLINPSATAPRRKDVQVYKVEPYVVAADVYAVPPHTGRGGWTWYTGSAGWMYRLITESLLGLQAGSRYAPLCAVPPRKLDDLQDPLSLPRNFLSHHHPQRRRRQIRPARRGRWCGTCG